MTVAAADTALVTAETALAAAKAQPAIALETARTVHAEFDGEAAAVAGWACGVALFELGANDEALTWLKRAVHEVSPARRPRVQVSLAAAVAASGETETARRLLTDAGRTTDAASRTLSYCLF